VELIDWGTAVAALPDGEQHARLRELLQACERHPDFEVVQVRALAGPEQFAIVVDAGDGTVAPGNAVGLRRRERLALTFHAAADIPPDVRALRRDFPDTLHQNAPRGDEPRSLCLYDQPWSTIERSWTPQKHLRQILRWLEKTADGTLHADDQTLEQLFFTTGEQVIVPASMAHANAGDVQALQLVQAHRENGRATLTVAPAESAARGVSEFDLLTITVAPVGHPPVRRPPNSLGMLADQLESWQASLFPALLDAVRVAGQSGVVLASTAGPRRVLLLVRIPRRVGEEIKRVDVRGFIIEGDLARLGLAMGALRQDNGQVAYSFQYLAPEQPPAVPEGQRWRDFKLYPVDVRYSPDRALARWMSGVPDAGADFHGVLAGAGALGSTLADLWTRAGWGHWDVVDYDLLEPHNPVRHVANISEVGQAKANVLRRHMDALLDTGTSEAAAIVARANATGTARLDAVIARAKLLVDATTTIDVPRDFSERDGPRVASAFLTPSGRGAVLLLEDAQRSLRATALEAQYYRAVLTQPWGSTHLNDGEQVRIGMGCRDRSLVLSHELITLHAAQLARRIRLGVASDEAQISVWTLDDASGGVAVEHVVPAVPRGEQLLGWKIRWDEALEHQLHEARRAAFPSETGGVLVGVVDHKLRTIHLVDGWSAPRDSQADATGFTRGKENVLEQLEECHRRTHRMVSYVGEWHSHPPGHSNAPSAVDDILLGKLALQLSQDGVPALMVIVGENGFGVSLGEVYCA
jgi:hypothetical protein